MNLFVLVAVLPFSHRKVHIVGCPGAQRSGCRKTRALLEAANFSCGECSEMLFAIQNRSRIHVGARFSGQNIIRTKGRSFSTASLNAMKNIALISFTVFFAGCTVSANNHHFELRNNSSKSYDNFYNTWCFVSESEEKLSMCSSPYERHSKSIGLIVPVIPQTDRSSALAYDIVLPRIVQFKNTSQSKNIILSWPSGFEVCSDSYAKSCVDGGSIKISPSDNVWLKVPPGAEHEITVSIGGVNFKVTVREFIDSTWHGVHV